MTMNGKRKNKSIIYNNNNFWYTYCEVDKMSVKIERINSNMVKEISYLLQTEVKNPNIKFVTITDVKVTNDLSFAKVYFTVLNEEYKKELLTLMITIQLMLLVLNHIN